MNNEYLKQAREYWDKLQQREKIMVSSMVTIIILFLFYVTFWLPLSKDIRKLRISVPKAESKLAIMHVQAAKIKSLKSRNPLKAGSGGLLTQLEQTATNRGLRQFITKMEPDGDSGVRITIEGVSFNNLLSLLSDLHKKSGLRVENANINPAEESPGIVNARLVLKGPEA
ncbi:MAG: type II secretion system protein GspM [Acidiferrobacterales bacterium]